MSYAHATAPVTIRWFAGGTRVVSWDNLTSVRGFCTATSIIRGSGDRSNCADEEQTSFVWEENG